MAPRSSKAAVILCLFQSMAGLLFGWENSSTSGLYVMPRYQQRFGVCDAYNSNGSCTSWSLPSQRQSVIAACLSVGAFLGAFGSGPISTRYGLRLTCLAFIFVFMVGIAIECSAFNTYGQICVGRFLTGLGIGTTSGLVPVFQAEAAPPALRGLITGSFQLCVTLGIFLVNCVTYSMSKHSGDITWRLPIGIQLIWAALLFIGFALSPESPRFLARKNRWDEARINLARLRGLSVDDPEIELEMEEITVAKEEEDKRGDATYAECFSTENRIAFRTFIGLCVQIGQQVTGINFYFSYGSIFAQYAGLTNPYIFAIILSAVNVVASFPGILAVDRLGRRTVLLSGALWMLVSQIIVGAVSVALPGQAGAGKALTAFSALFVAGFAYSWGPIAWVVAAEVFPSRLANKCVTMAAAANWGMNAIIAGVAPIVQAKIQTKITFVWSGFLAASLLFAFFCIPETGGMSIEEIDALFISRTPAWRSKAIRRTQAQAEERGREKGGRTSEHHEQHHEKMTSSAATTAPSTPVPKPANDLTTTSVTENVNV